MDAVMCQSVKPHHQKAAEENEIKNEEQTGEK